MKTRVVNGVITIVAVNECAAAMFEYGVNDMIGMHLSRLIPHKQQRRQALAYGIALSNKDYESSIKSVTAVKSDGTTFTMWHEIAKCHDDEGDYFVSYLRAMYNTNIII